MFNAVNNPFGQRIESAISTGQEKRQHQQNQQQNEEKKYLENDDKDEVKIGGLPILTEDEIQIMTENYIAKLKTKTGGKVYVSDLKILPPKTCLPRSNRTSKNSEQMMKESTNYQ